MSDRACPERGIARTSGSGSGNAAAGVASGGLMMGIVRTGFVSSDGGSSAAVTGLGRGIGTGELGD